MSENTDCLGRPLPSRQVTDRIREIADGLDLARRDTSEAPDVDYALDQLRHIAEGCSRRRREVWPLTGQPVRHKAS